MKGKINGKMKGVLLIAVFILSTLTLAIPLASAATITVGSGTEDHETIQAAINAASAGDTIIVSTGIYSETLDVDESVSLISAEGPSETIIKVDVYGIIILADDVTIEGFTITDTSATTGTTIGLMRIGLDRNSDPFAVSGVTIRDNIFSDFITSHESEAHGAIGIGGSHDGDIKLVSDILITGNTFENLESTSSMAMIPITIFDDTTGDVAQPSNIDITDNIIHNIVAVNVFTAKGISIEGDDVTIQNNEIYDISSGPEGVGICIWNGETIDITDGNEIYDIDTGIFVYPDDSSDVDVSGNDIHNTAIGIRLYAATTVDVEIHDNNIYDNTYGVAWDTGENPEVDATLNWWGHLTGPKQATTNPDATGDEISDYVDYDPWLLGLAPDGLPSTGSVGDEGFVSGTEVTLGGLIKVYWESACAWDGTVGLLAETYAVGTSYSVEITIPDDEEGEHYIIADDVEAESRVSVIFTMELEDDFAISVDPAAYSVAKGGTTSPTITVTKMEAYAEIVTLTSSGEPTDVTVIISPTIPPGGIPTCTATMNILVAETALAGIYPITITGTGADEKTHTATFTLTVTDVPVEITVSGDGDVDVPDADLTIYYDNADGCTISFEDLAEEDVEDVTFGALGEYFDVQIEAGTVDELVLDFHYTDADVLAAGLDEKQLVMQWYDGTYWLQCSDSWVDTKTNILSARIDDLTSPSLSDMTGTPFGPGVGIALDSEWYHTDDFVTVSLYHQPENKNPTKKDLVPVYMGSDTESSKMIVLTETGVDTSLFKGTFKLVKQTPEPEELLVRADDRFYVEYEIITNQWTRDEATVDDKKPTVDSLLPVKNAITTNNRTTISAYAADDNLKSAYMTVDGEFRGIPLTSSDTITYTPDTLNPLSEGRHTVVVKAEDLAGNTNTTTWYFTVDTMKPTATISMNVTGDVKAGDVEFYAVFSESMRNSTKLSELEPLFVSNKTSIIDFAASGKWTANKTYTIKAEIKGSYNGSLDSFMVFCS